MVQQQISIGISSGRMNEGGDYVLWYVEKVEGQKVYSFESTEFYRCRNCVLVGYMEVA